MSIAYQTMRHLFKTLIAYSLFLTPLFFVRCATSRVTGGDVRNDSLVTISRQEYELLRQRADERYVVVQRQVFDSLLMKTKALQELCDALVKHLPEEVRSVNNPTNQPIQ